MTEPDPSSGAPPSALPAADVLRLAFRIGALAGAGEVAIVALRKLVFGRFAFVGVDFAWMSPVANALLFTALGVAWLGARSAIARLRTRAAAMGAFATLALFAIALHDERLHPAAAAVLAAGIAAGIARARATPRPAPRAWRTALALTLVALGVRATAHYRERAALDGVPPARAGAPNVLLVVLDTVRAKSTSLAGGLAGSVGTSRRTTPFLEGFAREGARFDRAWSTSSWTLPSHASLFTGRYPHELSANWGYPLDLSHPVLAQVLGDAGYRTAGFVANQSYCDAEFGLARGFARYEDYAPSWRELGYSAILVQTLAHHMLVRRATGCCAKNLLGHKTARQVNEAFLAWLDGRADAGSRPFFAFLNYMDAHAPYFPPPPYDDQYARPGTTHDPFQWRFWRRFIEHDTQMDPAKFPATEARGHQDAYEGAIRYLDRELEALAGELARRGLLDHTLVVVTADHGEQFGERGAYSHGLTLCAAETHVPLAMRLPGAIPAGRTVPESVTLRDVPATILALAGTPGRLPGRSLAHHWDAGAPAGTASAVLSSLDGWRGIEPAIERREPAALTHHALVVGRYRALAWPSGRVELFDLETDPEERRDLSRTVEGERAIAEFRQRLAELGIR